MGAPLNLDGVQHQKVRELIDARFRALVDSLEDAYYGTAAVNGARASDGWRHGLSHPWHGFDVLASPAQSKAQFDLLHGVIWWAHGLVFHEVNQALAPAERIPLVDYDLPTHDADGTSTTKVVLAKTVLKRIRTQRPALFNAIRTWVLNQSWVATYGVTFDPDA